MVTSSFETAKKIKSLLKNDGMMNERDDAIRLDELRRVFAGCWKDKQQQPQPQPQQPQQQQQQQKHCSKSEVHKRWNAFLQKHLDLFVKQLVDRMPRKSAVRTMWGVLASCPKPDGMVDMHLMQTWVAAIDDVDKAMHHMIQQEFLSSHHDASYYALLAVHNLANQYYQDNNNNNKKTERLFSFLLMIPTVSSQTQLDNGNYLFKPNKQYQIPSTKHEQESSEEEEDSDNDDDDDDSEQERTKKTKAPMKRKKGPPFQQLRCHRKALSDAWFSILKLPLSTLALKRALQMLPDNVLTRIHDPLRFADFFVQAFTRYDKKSALIAVLALDGLFLLMTQHGLECPHYYHHLYRLVGDATLLFHAKHRARFFVLLSKSLSRNTMLPAHLVASFCKRLLRSCLTGGAPPSGTLFALALCSNLLRKHASCACLIHRTHNDENVDVFDAETHDPTKTRALESSLWELHALSRHYYPPVATLARSIGTEDKTVMHDTEDDFVRHTYKSLFDQERSKKRRKVALTFVEPKSLFVQHDVFSGMLQTTTNE